MSISSSRPTGAGGRGGQHRPSHSYSASAGQKAQLTTAYHELGRELSSTQIKSVGNYVLGRVIGEGSFGKVRLAVHKLTSQRCAIKQIPRTAATPLLTREIHHHRRLHHPSVLQLFEVIATEQSIWLVSELCAGGELFDYLVEKGRLGEWETRRIFGQLALGVGYIHSQGVVHRDLKLENILLDERCNVKVADFGFGREFEQRRLMETFCGTTGYAAPEMLAGKKYTGEEVDIWSLGVILYTLLTGSLPFDDDDDEIMKQKIMAGKFNLPAWISEDSRSLICGILRQEPRERFTIGEILGHDWFIRAFQPSPSPVDYFAAHADSLPPMIPEESGSPTTDGLEGVIADNAILERPAEPSSATSEASTSSFRSAMSTSDSDIGLGIQSSRSNTSMSSIESQGSPSRVDKGKAVDRGVDEASLVENARLHRNSSQTTITSPRPTRNRSHLLSVHVESPITSYRFPPPSPALSETVPFGSPALHVLSRTPSRTKRRSVGSAMSERLLPGFDPLPDFLSLLASASTAPFTTPLEKQLLDSLALLGLDTGQMIHSVRSHACDASGAMWWMLRLKAEQRELEMQETASIAPARSASMSSLAPSTHHHYNGQAGRASPLPDRVTDSETTKQPASEEISGVAAVPARLEQLVTPPSPLMQDAVEYGGPSYMPSPRRARALSPSSSKMSSISAPALSPGLKISSPNFTLGIMSISSASFSPSQAAPSKPAEIRKLQSSREVLTASTKSLTKPRSASVSTVGMLARAGSALGVTKSAKGDEPTHGETGRGTPNSLAAALFSRKPSSGSAADKPTLTPKHSGDRTTLLSSTSLSDPDSRSVTSALDDSVQGKGKTVENDVAASLRSHETAAPRDSPSGHSTVSRDTLSSLGSFAMPESPTGSTALRSSVPVRALPDSPAKANRASKNLFSSFKLWFNDDRRKRRQRQSSAQGSLDTPATKPDHFGSVRRVPVYANSPLQRPPIARVPSNGHASHLPSRRSSTTSGRHVPLYDTASPAVGHRRRRSDASRRSFGSVAGARTPVGDLDEVSRPGSAQSGGPGCATETQLQHRRHARASSSSSAGSRQTTLITGSPVATFRRTPAVTQVRRISTPQNLRRRSHSRNNSNPSSVHTNDSRRSSLSEIVHGERTVMEENEAEDMVETERGRALKKLSGDETPAVEQASVIDVSQFSATGEVKPGTLRQPSVEAGRRHRHTQSHQLQMRSDSQSSDGLHPKGQSRHASASSLHAPTVFAAHKVVNPFGTPNGSHYTPNSLRRSSKESVRPVLRDVFRNKKADGDGEWVDEDEELAAYSGGFGQTCTRDGATSSGKAQPSPATTEHGIGYGRYAGMSTPKPESAPPALGPWRKDSNARAPVFKRAATLTEEEEEEE